MVIAEIWRRIEATLRASAPKFSLPPGASEDRIAECERSLGIALPADYRASVAIHDGTDGYLVHRCELASLGDVVENGRLFAELTREHHPIPASEWMRVNGPIRAQRWSPQWIPIAKTLSADSIVIDLDPPAGGVAGQVIHLTREMRELDLVAPSFQVWIETFADDLEAGRYGVRVSNGDVMGLNKRS